MICVLWDDYFGTQRLAQLKGQMGDRSWQELNTTALDGQKLTVGELANACEALPFMAERRLVIVHRLLSRFEPRSGEAEPQPAKEPAYRAFADYLSRISPHTILVLVEPEPVKGHNPLLGAAKKAGAEVASSKALYGEGLRQWITQRVQERGGQITTPAANQLAVYVGNDLRLLDSELEKLVTYAGSSAITEEMVAKLVSQAGEARVFDLVDALGRRDSSTALRMLRRLLRDGVQPTQLLAMIARQWRLLLQFRELAGQGFSAEEIGERLHWHPYVLEKVSGQARRFEERQLEEAYAWLLETDVAIKTGRMAPAVALDLLVMELAGRSRSPAGRGDGPRG